MNIDPSNIYPSINSTANTNQPPDTQFSYKWPRLILPLSASIFASTVKLTPSEQLTVKKWSDLRKNNDLSQALSVLDAHNGKSIYLTSLKIETLQLLQSKEKITEIYLNNPNDTYDPRTLLIIAKSFFDQHEFNKTLECIQKSIVLDDSDPNALIFAGITSRLLDKIELFEDYFQKGISLAQKLNQTELEHQCYYALAIELYQRGKVDQAVEQLNKLPDTHSETVLLKASIYAKHKKEEQAVILLDKLLASPVPEQLKIIGDRFACAEKESPIFFILTYMCYANAGIAQDSQHNDQSAWLKANHQRFCESVLDLPKLLKQLKLIETAKLFSPVLIILQKRKRFDLCIAFLDEWHKEGPIVNEAVCLRAAYLINAGRLQEAEEALKTLSEPLPSLGNHLKMHLHVLHKNDEDAWVLSGDSFYEDKTNHYQWADIYLRNKGKHPLKKGNLIYAIAGYLHLYQAIYLGQFKAAQDPALLAKAKKDFHDALSKLIEKPIAFASDRSFYIFISRIWIILAHEKNDKLALSILKLLEPILENMPDEEKPNHYHRLIHSLYYSGQVEEAYKLLPQFSDEKIQELSLSTQASILTIKGVVLFNPKVGELDQAKACFQRALLIEPKDLCCLDSLSSIHMMQNEYASAITYLKTLLEVSPANLSIHNSLLHCLFYTDQMEEFEKSLSVLMPTSHLSREYLYWTTQLHLKKQEREKAKEALEKLLKLEKGLCADTPVVEIIKKLKESKKDEEALLLIQTYQQFPDIFTEDKILYMYKVFLEQLYSPEVKNNINYKEILANFVIYYYTRPRHLESLLLDKSPVLVPYGDELIRATMLNPRNPQLLTALGIHYTIGDSSPDEALKYLNQSIAISANGCNGLSYAFKAWNLFLKYASDGDDKKANLTGSEKIEIITNFKEALKRGPSALNWFLYACYSIEVFKDESDGDTLPPDHILAVFSAAITQCLFDIQFTHLITKKVAEHTMTRGCVNASQLIDKLNIVSNNSLTPGSNSPSLFDNQKLLKKAGVNILYDSHKDFVSHSSSAREEKKEKAGISSKELLRQLLIEKANEEKAAQERNAAAAASSSSSSSSSTSSSKASKKDFEAIQNFKEKQKEMEALEAARRQKELDREREENVRNREQRTPKNVLKQQEILRKKQQDKLLQEQRKKEHKKTSKASESSVQASNETTPVSPEPCSTSSTPSASKTISAAHKPLIADTRIGGIAVVKDKEDDKPLKEKKSMNVTVVATQAGPNISQALGIRLRAAKTALISIEGLIRRYNRGEYENPAEATKLKFNLMYQLLKLTEALCDTSDKKILPEENALPLSNEDKDFINSMLVERNGLYGIRNDIRSYFHFVTLNQLLNLAGEILKSPLLVNLGNILNKQPIAQKTTLLQVLCDAQDRAAWDKTIEEQKELGIALTFKLMHENFQLMFQFIKLKIDNFSEFWKSDEVKSACKTAISNLRKCLLWLNNYGKLKLFDVKGEAWSYLEAQEYHEISQTLLSMIDAGNRVGHHIENIGVYSADDLSDNEVHKLSCQSKKLEQFIAYTLEQKFPANILSLFKSIPDAAKFIRISYRFPKGIMEEIRKHLSLFENLAAKVKSSDALSKNIILHPMTKTFWNDLKNSINRLPASSAARIWDALKIVHQDLKADGEPSPAAIFQLIVKAKEISNLFCDANWQAK